MKTLLSIFIGLILGLIAAWLLALIILYVVPVLFSGLGQDAMSQGIMGTLILVVAAPVLGVIGGLIGYGQSKKGKSTSVSKND